MTDDVVDLDVEERRLKLQRGLQRKSPDKIQAQLLDLPDPIKAIPRRQWLYGQHYVRGFMSCTIGTGGVGKSNLILAEALAMASGHDLLGHPVEKPLKIWVHNGEDPKDELLRRFAAACIHYDLRREDYYGRLFVTSGRTMPILVAGMRHFDVVQNGAVVNQLSLIHI